MYPPHSQCFTFSHFIYVFFFLPDLPDHGEAHQFTDHFKELALVLVPFLSCFVSSSSRICS